MQEMWGNISALDHILPDFRNLTITHVLQKCHKKY